MLPEIRTIAGLPSTEHILRSQGHWKLLRWSLAKRKLVTKRALLLRMSCVSFLLVSCGTSEPQTKGSAAARESLSVTEAITSPPTTSEPFVPRESFTWTLERPSGDAITVAFSVGKLTLPAKAAPLKSGRNWHPGDCVVDDDRDLLAGFTFTVSNANSSLSQQVAAAIDGPLMNKIPDGTSLIAIAYYSDSLKCTALVTDPYTGGSALGLGSNEKLEPGESIEIEGFLVLKGVRGPGYETGDPARVKAISPMLVPRLGEGAMTNLSSNFVSRSFQTMDLGVLL